MIRTDVWDAVAALDRSATPGGPAPHRSDLDVVRRWTSRLLAKAEAGERARLAATTILAHSRAGAIDDALVLADSEVARARRDAAADPSAIATLLTAAAEAYVTAGWIRRSTPLASEALAYAERLEDEATQYQAHGLLAVSRALNGEYAAAVAHSSAARALQQRHDWITSYSALPLLLGEILIASARLDVSWLGNLTDEIRTAEPDSAVWLAAAANTEAMVLLLRRDVARGIPLLLSVIGSTNEEMIFPILRDVAYGIYADMLLGRGEARRVLTLLKDRPSPPGHNLCFDMQRSAAHLLLGEDRAALVTTDACIRLGPEHCLRTVPPLLLRRAIAQLRLGQVRAADESFEEAFRMLQQSGSGTPLLTLPREPLMELAARLEQRHPADAAALDALRDRLAAVPAVDLHRPTLPPLTPRERVLAEQLRSGQSAASIALELHVSHNTVKSQLRTLYRKLNATTRDQALGALEYAGFFD